MTEAVISTRNLTRRFGPKVALDRLSLEVKRGEVFGFLGHNGAGKTTTVRLLNGVLSATEGQASVLGLDPFTDGHLLRRRTGVLTESPSISERLTGRENLTFFAEAWGVPRSAVRDRVSEFLVSFNLTDSADLKTGAYSKGMKQRLALARALIHQPELLFLDEPTAGLDPVASRRVHEMIGHLSKEEGRTIFLCTHNLAEAQLLCSRVAVLAHGRVLASGTPEELGRQIGGLAKLEIEVDEGSASLACRIASSVGGARVTCQRETVVTLAGLRRENVPGLLDALVAAGIRVFSVIPEQPSLEDVYFALQGGGEGWS